MLVRGVSRRRDSDQFDDVHVLSANEHSPHVRLILFFFSFFFLLHNFRNIARD